MLNVVGEAYLTDQRQKTTTCDADKCLGLVKMKDSDSFGMSTTLCNAKVNFLAGLRFAHRGMFHTPAESMPALSLSLNSTHSPPGVFLSTI